MNSEATIVNYMHINESNVMSIKDRFIRNLWSYAHQSYVNLKELRESFDYVKRIRKEIKDKKVLELFCGHGLVGFLLSYRGARSVISIDQNNTKAHVKLESYFNNWTNVIFHRMDIVESVDEIIGMDFNAVVSMHACGELTDLAIDIAIKKNAISVSCPCCYHLTSNPIKKVFWKNRPDVMDGIRCNKLLEAGYDVRIKTLNSGISPMNRIIVGIPNGVKYG